MELKLIWHKRYDYLKESHVYTYANNALCNDLFKLNYLKHEEQLDYIKGRSDLDIIKNYRERTGKRHSYGELCLGTDDYTREFNQERIKKGLQPISLTFLEIGIIDGEPLVLKVNKQPIFKNANNCNNCQNCKLKNGEYCGTVGFGINVTNYFDSVNKILESGLADKLCEGVYLIKQDKEFNFGKLENK